MKQGYHNKYSRIYKLLKRFGFSPAKAVEIILDGIRGDNHAKLYIKLAFAGRR